MSETTTNTQLETQTEVTDKALDNVAELFRVLGDPTRVRIIWALFEKELCVSDLANLLDMSPSAISHQLRVLKDAKLVKYRRNGRTRYYALDDSHVYTIFNQGLSHVLE